MLRSPLWRTPRRTERSPCQPVARTAGQAMTSRKRRDGDQKKRAAPGVTTGRALTTRKNRRVTTEWIISTTITFLHQLHGVPARGSVWSTIPMSTWPPGLLSRRVTPLMERSVTLGPVALTSRNPSHPLVFTERSRVLRRHIEARPVPVTQAGPAAAGPDCAHRDGNSMPRARAVRTSIAHLWPETGHNVPPLLTSCNGLFLSLSARID